MVVRQRRSFWFKYRLFLYKSLVMRFGPISDWHSLANPTGNPEDYEIFLAEIAAMISAEVGRAVSAKAVMQQISWALTKQGEIRGSQVLTFMANKVAAYEAGFIDSSYLPDLLLGERKEK